MAGALLVSEFVLRLANPSIPPAVDLGWIPPERAADVSAMPTPIGRDTSGAATDDDSPSGTGVRDHANERGGYAFSYPAGWNVLRDGEVSELRSPDDLVVFSFGPAPAGALSDAATAVAERYSDSEMIEIVSSREDATEQGLRTWVVGGIGRIPAGPHDRFLAMAVDAPRGNQAIVVRFPSGPAVLDLLPEIEGVISSYRDTSMQATASSSRTEWPSGVRQERSGPLNASERGGAAATDNMTVCRPAMPSRMRTNNQWSLASTAWHVACSLIGPVTHRPGAKGLS